MFKLSEAADLEKAGRSLGSYFAKQAEELQKTHAFHAAAAAHHDAMKAAHTEHAAHHKATHDGLPDDHELKAHFAKGHTHHTSMAAHHEALAKAHAAHAETLKTEIDTMKALSADWGGIAAKTAAAGDPPDLSKTTGIGEKFQVVTDTLVTKALEQISTSPAVAEVLERYALEHIQKLLGDKIGDKLVPTNVSALAPNRPGLTMVPRGGQPAVPEKPNVPLEFEKLVRVDEDEERIA